jgi:hypothetical protein
MPYLLRRLHHRHQDYVSMRSAALPRAVLFYGTSTYNGRVSLSS